MSTRQLFGGAITVELPGKLLDASDLRQVPDNQEVLLGLEDDTTIIVEVLESVKEGVAKDSLEEAIRFHFASLAHDNSASSSQVAEVFSLPSVDPSAAFSTAQATPSPILLVGEQVIQKFAKENEPQDRVRIYLALWRLAPTKDVDLIMSLNEPLLSSKEPIKDARDTFVNAARSLHIHDWGLFAG